MRLSVHDPNPDSGIPLLEEAANVLYHRVHTLLIKAVKGNKEAVDEMLPYLFALQMRGYGTEFVTQSLRSVVYDDVDLVTNLMIDDDDIPW